MQEEIIQEPSKYVELDPDMAQTLIDMRQAVRAIGNLTKMEKSDAQRSEILLGSTWRCVALDSAPPLLLKPGASDGAGQGADAHHKLRVRIHRLGKFLAFPFLVELLTRSERLFFERLVFADKMMSYAYNRFMPQGATWRDLFDMVSCR